MSTRITRFATVALLVTLLLAVSVVISQGQAPDDGSRAGQAAQSSYTVAAGQAAATIATTSGVFAIPSGTVAMTELGAQPANITVTVGAQVFWVNNTAAPIRVSNQPVQPVGGQLYLPLVARTGAQTTVGANAGGAQPASLAPAADVWVSDPIAPGGQYGRVFVEAGDFSYYASHASGIAGVVTVVSDTLASTVYVEAENGGTVTAGDAALLVPPGALAQDTVITVGRPISGASLSTDGMTAVSLEGEGLDLLSH